MYVSSSFGFEHESWSQWKFRPSTWRSCGVSEYVQSPSCSDIGSEPLKSQTRRSLLADRALVRYLRVSAMRFICLWFRSKSGKACMLGCPHLPPQKQLIPTWIISIFESRSTEMRLNIITILYPENASPNFQQLSKGISTRPRRISHLQSTGVRGPMSISSQLGRRRRRYWKRWKVF